MKREMFEVWEEPSSREHPVCSRLPWRAQLPGGPGYFPSKEDAEKYVASVKAHREKFNLK